MRLADGDAIVLHDDRPDAWRDGERAVLLVHGLAGCHGSPYLVRTAAKLNDAGVRTFRMDLRGMGAAQELARHLAHAGRSDDVHAALKRVIELCGTSPISLVGFSLGGNLVLKLLGEIGDETPTELESALAVAPPVELEHCTRSLGRGLRRLYSRAFTRMLLRLVKQRPEIVAETPGLLEQPPRSLWEFDDRITSKLSGFRDAEDYYTQSSSARCLDRIKLPTLILAAEDDPVVPVEMFRRARMSPSTSLFLVPAGGHVGFYGRSRVDPDRWWLDWRIVQWVLALSD